MSFQIETGGLLNDTECSLCGYKFKVGEGRYSLPQSAYCTACYDSHCQNVNFLLNLYLRNFVPMCSGL